MKQIRWSSFVISVNAEEYSVLFNSVSRVIYIIDSDIKKQIDEYMQHLIPLSNDTKKIVSKLYQQEFIVLSEINEIQNFKTYRYNYYNKIFGTVLYILPTLRCNFVCPYCIQREYINEDSGEIQEKTIDKLAEWIVSFAQSNKNEIMDSLDLNKNSNSIKLVFFGGEPTLQNDKNYRIIDKIGERLPEWLNLSFTIITNGFEISDETILEYKRRGLAGFQITLDGPPDIHNARRTTKDSIPSFSNVLSTIKRSADLGVKVAVRINVDESNVDNIEQLIDILLENQLDGNVHLNIAPVDKNSSDAEMDGHSVDVLHKFYPIFKKALFSKFTISLWECFCGVYARSFFVVTPDGDLFKCPSLLEKEHKVGSVFKPELNTYYHSIINHQLSDNCMACSYVGLCGGGCYNQNVMNNGLMCQKYTFVPLVEAYCKSMGEYIRRTI